MGKSGQGNYEPAHFSSRAFCFSSFNEEKPQWCNKTMRYLCFAPEICPTTGAHHWQSFVYFKHDKTNSAAAKFLSKNMKKHINVEPKSKHSTFTQCKFYISGPYEKDDKKKEENEEFEEFGILPKQGARSDLEKVAESINEGGSVDQLAVDDPYMFHQYGRTLEKLEDLAHRKKFRQWMTKCTWYYGKTGTGKSHMAFKDYNPDTCYIFNSEDKGWWDGYAGHDTVIINEFRGELKYKVLLELIDKWPYNVPRRNRAPTPFLAKRIIVTSAVTPEDIYVNLSERDSLDQLYRRIDLVELKDRPLPVSGPLDEFLET